MNLMIGSAAYMACGALFLGSVGRKRSRLQWDEPPTPMRRLITVAAWPAIVAMVVLGSFDVPGDDDVNRML